MDTDRFGVASGTRVASGTTAASIRWPPLSPEYSVIVKPTRDILVKMVRNRRPIRPEYGAPSFAEREPSLRQSDHQH